MFASIGTRIALAVALVVLIGWLWMGWGWAAAERDLQRARADSIGKTLVEHIQNADKNAEIEKEDAKKAAAGRKRLLALEEELRRAKKSIPKECVRAVHDDRAPIRVLLDGLRRDYPDDSTTAPEPSAGGSPAAADNGRTSGSHGVRRSAARGVAPGQQ